MVFGGTKLRDLVRSIRSAKTAADERSIVAKECAKIRTSFKEDDTEARVQNVSKLLYIYMLGYPAHFGQLECMKLATQPRFTDKRMGYLGVMLLLDERNEAHILVTNCLKNDMNHKNKFVVSLALATLATICSSEMARDLSSEVEKLLKSSSSYVRKKAALCAMRIVRKEPDLLENFVPTTRALITQGKNHGSILTGVALITEMCRVRPDTIPHFRRLVEPLVTLLKNLVMSGFNPEHDVCGVTDPFLQSKILRLLGILGENDAEASEEMNDLLAQVATNTEASKNVGNAILYDTVLTIMSIEAESGLRVLAINILGKFLSHADKNIRYVALNMLLKVSATDRAAVQRHRRTVLECLHDPDSSLRRRASELVFKLMNQSNIRSIAKEVLCVLNDNKDPEHRKFIVNNLCEAAHLHAPTTRWYIDTMVSTLEESGNEMLSEGNMARIIARVSEAHELHGYTSKCLYNALLRDISQQTLIQVAAWCFGEYGDMLVSGVLVEELQMDVDPLSLTALMKRLMTSSTTSAVSKAFVINALVKLAVRLQPQYKDEVEAIIRSYQTSVDSELQQRSSEYVRLLTSHSSVSAGILERMPKYEGFKAFSDAENGQVADRPAAGPGTGGSVIPPPAPASSFNTTNNNNVLLDLLGDDEDVTSTPTAIPSGGNSSAAMDDLLGILGGGSTTSLGTASSPFGSDLDFLSNQATPSQHSSGLFDVDGLLAGVAEVQVSNPQSLAYEKPGVIKIIFEIQRDTAMSTITLLVKATNLLLTDIVGFDLQIAVAKTHTLSQMRDLAASHTIPANTTCNTHEIRVQCQPDQIQACVPAKIKVGFSSGGNAFQDVNIHTVPAAQ